MLSTSDFRNGLKIEIEGEPYAIVEFQHVKPGKGGAFVRTKLKGIKTGAVIDRTFRSGEKFDEPNLEEKEMQYLYTSEGQYNFMDNKNYEQILLTEEQLGESKKYIKENMNVKILFYNEKALGVEVPMFVELKIVKTDPGVRGDTATGGAKPATLETGAVIKVPLYMNEGEVIKVDTRTGEYIERVR
ncbi:MAG: elongation factor P [Nitrospirae bacterium]|nr:elongation factor P [Nitrospirota bacterium]